MNVGNEVCVHGLLMTRRNEPVSEWDKVRRLLITDIGRCVLDVCR
jgi:predicted methyltransferase